MCTDQIGWSGTINQSELMSWSRDTNHSLYELRCRAKLSGVQEAGLGHAGSPGSGKTCRIEGFITSFSCRKSSLGGKRQIDGNTFGFSVTSGVWKMDEPAWRPHVGERSETHKFRDVWVHGEETGINNLRSWRCWGQKQEDSRQPTFLSCQPDLLVDSGSQAQPHDGGL